MTPRRVSVVLTIVAMTGCQHRAGFSVPTAIEKVSLSPVSRVEGRVVMLDTDQPIANASIQIVEEISKQVVRSESSGPDGRFSVRVRSGTFILRVHAKGFSALEATVKVTPEARRNIGRVELRPGV